MSALRLRGSDGVTLAADSSGAPKDPAVVLLHGGGQTRHAWGATREALAGRGWFALSVDLRGHGDSDWSPDGIYDIERFGADVTAIAEELSRPVLVGASLGGLSSLVAVGDGGPDLASALVLVDVAPSLERRGVQRISDFMRQGLDGFASLEAVADAIASYLPDRPRPATLDGVRKNVRLREDGRWVWHWDPRFMTRIDDNAGEPTGGRFSPLDRLSEACRRVTIPTLLVRGASSDVVSVEAADELRRLVPHAELVDVAGAGHMVAGDRNDAFTASVAEFLERVVRPQRSARSDNSPR